MTEITGRNGTPVIAVVGWKNSGKTTLTARLVAELVLRGYRVATVKHTHHAFEIDGGDTDSARHRRAGARQVAVVSPERMAVIKELSGEAEPGLAEIVALLEPCDVIIAEGYKRADVPKIEARRRDGRQGEALAARDPGVVAVAADHDVDASGRPLFALDDIDGLAGFIEREVIRARPGEYHGAAKRP